MMPACPSCGASFVRRARRRGVMEHVASVFSWFPFRCQLCTVRFTRRIAGAHFRKQTLDMREFERLPADFRVTLLAKGARTEATSRDISMAGCGIQARSAPPDGTLVEAVLHIPTGNPVRVDAAVVRCADVNALGVQFLRWQPQEQERLRQFIHTLIPEDPQATTPLARGHEAA